MSFLIIRVTAQVLAWHLLEALYGRPCRSPVCWPELGESSLYGPKIVQETTWKVSLIRQQLRTAQSRQKSYADQKRRQVEFIVGDHVLLRVLPMKGVMRFGKKGKLVPRYVGPFPIIERVGAVAYRLALSEHLSAVHNVFDISMLRKHLRDEDHPQLQGSRSQAGWYLYRKAALYHR